MDSDQEPKRPLQFSIDLNEDPPTPPSDPPPSDPNPFSDHEPTPDKPGPSEPEGTPDSTGPSEPMQFLPYEAYMLACKFHGVVTPSRGLPAEFPGEAGFGLPALACGYCTRAELPGATMVCDGCERGFHLACAVPPAMWHQRIDEWVCPECLAAGVPARKWSLAGGANPMLDMNAPPPSEAEASQPQQSGILSRYQRPNESDLSPLSGLATSLRHFAINNSGILTDSTNRGSFHIQGLPTDGRHFMPAFNLGPGSMYLPTEADSINDSLVPHRSTYVRRRRVRSNIFTASYLAQNQEILRAGGGSSNSRGLGLEPFMDLDAMQPRFSDSAAPPRLPRYLIEENGRYTQRDLGAGFPIQFEDYYIVNLGEVDFRMAYHTNCEIFPVGFTSYWHDRVTCSLFEFEVLDGGNNGPHFRVRRIPCSAFPLPSASTVLFPNTAKAADSSTDKTDSAVSCITTAPDGEDDIMALLEEPGQLDEDLTACLKGNLGNKQEASGSQLNLFSSCTEKEASPTNQIGEFVVQGENLTLVWGKVVCTILDACCELYRRSGKVQFCCNHVSDSSKTMDNLGHLAKVCCACGPVGILKTIQNEKDLESSCLAVREWLDRDRAGLDFEFVQEIIENLLPACGNCTRYHFLSNRSNFLESLTVASENLVAVPKNGVKGMVEALYWSRKLHRNDEPPGGKPFSKRLPAKLAGDVFQIWEFMYRFKDILDLQELPSYEDIEEELINPWPETPRVTRNQLEVVRSGAHDQASRQSGNGEGASMFVPVETSFTREASLVKLSSGSLGHCGGVWLATIHISLLKLLLNEVISRVMVFVDPTAEARESRPRRGRRKDVESSASKELKVDILTLNELTWPELARRYALAVAKLGASVDLSDTSCSDGVKVFRALQGDGGMLFGAISGVSGIKADALLLAEAQRQIRDPANEEKIILMGGKDNSDKVASPLPPIADVNVVPEWAQPLENVRKLPTNVGTRIRKCIFEALERNPPDWAKKILEHSISKEVYKGNASGPTKKLALSVLADASGGTVPQKLPEKKPEKESQKTVSIPDSMTKMCRIMLRQALTTITEKQKNFCNLLGTSLVNSDEEEFEGIIGFPAMFSRPIDFRTIDMRLATGAYCGSHDAFMEDVREVLQNLRIAHADDASQLEKVEKLSENFESLYKNEVLNLVQKFATRPISSNHDKSLENELIGALAKLNDLPKAPWDDGLCKVCGVDRDDKSVLLCDTCDSEYHTYCLNPPLARIPDGNWYCPSCCKSKGKEEDKERHDSGSAEKRRPKGYGSEDKSTFKLALSRLVSTMEQREYWEMSVDERIFLLKFLCHELLNSSFLREHIDQCIDKSIDLQQKLKSLGSELRNLKVREDILAIKALKSDSRPNSEPNNEECTTSLCSGDANQSNNETGEGATNGDPIDNSTRDNEMDTIRNEISTLQDAIIELELQLSKVCLRREFLGRDTLGRLYWITTRPGKRPWLVVDGTASLQKEKRNEKSSFLNRSMLLGRSEPVAEVAPSFVLYESEEEVHALVNWLRDGDPRERELKETILTLQRLVFNQDSSSDNPFLPRKILSPQLKSRALGILESQFGDISDDEIKELPKRPKKKGKMSEEKMFRCECLEPIWTCRNHCFSCHNTFSTQTELDAHSKNKCTPKIKTKTGVVGNENMKDKDDRMGTNLTRKCPFDFDEICKRFIVKDSIKEDVQQIGLIGSNGVPSFVNKRAKYLDSDNLALLSRKEDVGSGSMVEAGLHLGHSSHLTPTEEHSMGKRKELSDNEKVVGSIDNVQCTVPETSLRMVKGRNAQLVRFLKMDLLDMEAALPDESLRLMRYDSGKRRAWRAFVKTAESIYEMVQAIILLESMIKSEYIKPQWWHWSSLTAAAKTPSITSLALRLYTLDDCIVYTKHAPSAATPEPTSTSPCTVKPSNKGKKRKESD
ncbi:methyl-CPG-binding domain 9 [Rhynchospora pubera]|uniref:Methyl-CPG-binding domain 9 n=1 Tax=Rhynchospora pubera TaxID=906938 RepID=A0AAV8G022_9POAL|nr:methyl-CPG-binding domain 9 [Rhynchospora pubera]